MTPEQEYKRGWAARFRQEKKPRIYPPGKSFSYYWAAKLGGKVWVARTLQKLCSMLPVVPEPYRK